MEAWKLVVSLIIGAVIGLERESQGQQANSASIKKVSHFAGVRTFSLLTVLGTIAGMMMNSYFSIFVVISIVFGGILLVYYVLNTLKTTDHGLTTELAILYAYIIGLLIALEAFPIQLTLAMSVVLTLILSRKKDISAIIKGIQREELHAFISYALIALVILPFLPNKTFSLSDIPFFNNLNLGEIIKLEFFNPFKLWLIVVLVTGIDMAGYVLERTIGRKGRFIASIVGGFISSTATTISLAQESKTAKKGINFLVAAAIFSNTASFLQIFILISLVNAAFLPSALPFILAITVGSLIPGIYFYKNRGGEKKRIVGKNIKGIKESEIFALVPALKFAVIFLLVIITTQIALRWFGQAGFLIASSLASLTGIDAVTINISQQAAKTINIKTAIFALILMNSVNLLAKSVYSFIQGQREFAIKFTVSVLIIILVSLVGLLFV